MKAVVMAGGEGSRLRPLTIRRPKPLIPLVNKPVMSHIVDLLKRHDITDVVATVQYLANQIQEYFRDGSGFGVRMAYSHEEVPLGTAGSVKNAQEYLDDTFIVISGDALTDFDLTDLIRFHKEKRAIATLCLYRVPNPLEYGVIITDQDGRIRQFLEKPSWGEVFSDTVNTGIYVLDPKIFEYFESGKVFDFSRDLFPMLLEKGEPLYGYVADGYWCDVGSIAEYVRATADYLEGKTGLDMPGRQIGERVWVEEDVEIAPDAQLYGPVYLGPGVKVRERAVIHGPSVIRDATFVDRRAAIDRSIVMRGSYIGERAELRGAIVMSQSSVKSRAMVFEGAVIGDGTVIGEGAVIQPSVKIWPHKEIEAGARVSASIIWGSQGRRVLFGQHGVSGLVNVDITPEFAAKLGAAYGGILPKGSRVVVSRDVHHTPRMVKRGIIAGLPSAGANVADVRTVPIPVARYLTMVSEAAGGIHVRLSPFDERVVDVRFFDRRGLDVDKSTERKLENIFFREDFRRVYLDEIGRIEYEPNVIERYTEGFLREINVDVIRSAARQGHLVVDYAHATSSMVLPSILNRLGCDVVALNAGIDESKLSRSSDDIKRSLDRLGAITATLQAALGVYVDVGGDKAFFVDDRGQTVPGMQALAAITALYLQSVRGGKVAVPVTAPRVFEEIAARYEGEIVRTKANLHTLMATAMKPGVILAGDGEGSFIFPEFHAGPDGLFAVVKVLELTATHRTSFGDTLRTLPYFATTRVKVPCPWEDKGRVMRLLNEQYKSRGTRQIDGVRIDLGREWVLILPDADRPYFHVYAEADSERQATVLAEKYAHVVNALQH